MKFDYGRLSNLINKAFNFGSPDTARGFCRWSPFAIEFMFTAARRAISMSDARTSRAAAMMKICLKAAFSSREQTHKTFYSSFWCFNADRLELFFSPNQTYTLEWQRFFKAGNQELALCRFVGNVHGLQSNAGMKFPESTCSVCQTFCACACSTKWQILQWKTNKTAWSLQTYIWPAQRIIAACTRITHSEHPNDGQRVLMMRVHDKQHACGQSIESFFSEQKVQILRDQNTQQPLFDHRLASLVSFCGGTKLVIKVDLWEQRATQEGPERLRGLFGCCLVLGSLKRGTRGPIFHDIFTNKTPLWSCLLTESKF